MFLCGGSALADCIVKDVENAPLAEEIGIYPGGEALNEAIILSRLGEKVRISTLIGNDYAGRLLKDLLNTEKVSITENEYDGRTPVSLLVVDPTGNRKSRMSKAHLLEGREIVFPEKEDIAFATMASLFRAPFLEPDAALRYAEAVKKKGAVLLADTKLPKKGDPQLSEFAGTLQLLDIITPNEEEAYHYTKKNTPEEAASVFRSFGVKNVIIKCGDRGAYCLCEDGTSFFQEAFRVPCRDAVGAGDNFNAGLLSSLGRGAGMKEAVRFGCACAAVSVTSYGAIDAVRSREQVEKLLTGC